MHLNLTAARTEEKSQQGFAIFIERQGQRHLENFFQVVIKLNKNCVELSESEEDNDETSERVYSMRADHQLNLTFHPHPLTQGGRGELGN